MSKKGQKNIISLLNFWHAAKKALFFSSSFFEGSLTIFLSLSLRDAKTHKINFPTNEEAHHNEQTTTRKKKRDGENDDAFISSGAKSSSSSSVFP